VPLAVQPKYSHITDPVKGKIGVNDVHSIRCNAMIAVQASVGDVEGHMMTCLILGKMLYGWQLVAAAERCGEDPEGNAATRSHVLSQSLRRIRRVWGHNSTMPR